MKRPDNFDELLEVAKNRPDLRGAMSRVGIELKRVGSSRGGTRYQTSTKGRSDGDLSSVVFIENANGSWVVIDNKERTGKRDLDAIAALREFGGVSFDDAVYMLSGGAPAMPPSSPKIVEPTVSAESQAPAEYVPPQPCRENTKNVIAYLTQGRNIPYSLVKALIDSGKIYPTYFENKETHKKTVMCGFKITDEHGNDVGCDSCAASTMMRFKHVYAGSSRDYAWCFNWGVDKITKDTPLYFCEAPIDAMSLCALSGMPGVYISLSGTKDMTFLSMKDKLGGKPVICTDHDGGAGDRFAEKHSEYDRLVPPHGKDWNDTLKHYVENNISFALQEPKQTEKTPKKAESAPEQSALEDKKEVISKVVDKALANKGDIGEKYNQKRISKVPEDVANYVLKASCGNIDISEKYIALNGADIWHEYQRHSDISIEGGRRQIALTPQTIKDAIAAIYEPEIVESLFVDSNNPTQRQSFAFAKKATNGQYVVVEAVGGNRNPNIIPIMILHFSEEKINEIMSSGKTFGELFFENDESNLSALDIQLNKKNRVTVAQFASNEAIANTPRSPQFINIISQNTNKVNTSDEKILKDEQPINPKEAEMAKTKEKSPEAEPKAQSQ